MPGRTSKLRWVIWSLAVLFYLYEVLLRISPTVMVDELINTFNVDAAMLGSLSAFYFYAYAPMQLPAGMLMDRFGARRLLTLSIFVCGLGSILFGFAPDLWIAELGRLLMGVGSSFAFVGMIYVSSHWFGHEKLAMLIGIGNSLGMIGAIVGEGPLSIGVDAFGWRGMSLWLGGIGIIFAFIFYFTVKGAPLKPTKKHTNDLQKLWENLKVVCSNPQTWLNGTIAMMIFATTSVFAGLWGDPFLQTAYGLSKERASFAISMVFVGWIVGGPIIGKISDTLKRRKPILLICTLVTLAALCAVIYVTTLPHPLLFALLFCVGFFSSAQLLNFSVAIEINPHSAKGTAAALTNFMIAAFGALLQPMVGLFLDFAAGAVEGAPAPIYTGGEYQLALSIMPVSLAVAFFLTLFLREK